MYKIFFPFLFLLVTSSFAQEYGYVDQKVKSYPEFESIQHLGTRITNDFDVDSLRVRAAFIWLTHNISYQNKSRSEMFQPKEKLVYYSEYGKEYQLQKKHEAKIKVAFAKKRGVCYDYSLLLHELCSFFGLESKIIIGITKNEIKDIKNEQLYKNHTWNAVRINGDWRLMDATWASGFIDNASNKFVRRYFEHYFFTLPSEFIKHHYPSQPEWQLLPTPIDIQTFFNAPIFFPEYFEKEVKLATDTKGIIPLTEEKEYLLLFEKIPRNHPMHYTVNGSRETVKIGFKKNKANNSYVSKIKLGKNLNPNDLLTIFLERKPILNFKIEQAQHGK